LIMAASEGWSKRDDAYNGGQRSGIRGRRLEVLLRPGTKFDRRVYLKTTGFAPVIK
jgi:hypothetical protein